MAFKMSIGAGGRSGNEIKTRVTRQSARAQQPDWSALAPEVLDMIATALYHFQPEFQARFRPWWERKQGHGHTADLFGRPDWAPLFGFDVDDSVTFLTAKSSGSAFPTSMEQFGCLSALELSRIAVLPEMLRHLPALRMLTLTAVALWKLSSWFDELPLAALELSFQRRGSSSAFAKWFREHGRLPKTLRRFKMQYDLEFLRLDCFAGLESLVVQELDHISVVKAQKLAPALAAAPMLESLYVCTERTHVGDGAALELLFRTLVKRSSPRLRELAVHGYRFDLASLQGLLLHKLALDRIHIEDTAEWKDMHMETEETDDHAPWLTSLPEWIAEMPLEELQVSGASALTSLPASLLSSLKSLKFLDLNLTGISCDFDGDYELNEEKEPPEAEQVAPQLAVRLFSILSHHCFIAELNGTPGRGWHGNCPGLISAQQLPGWPAANGQAMRSFLLELAAAAMAHHEQGLLWDHGVLE
ncbi:hypothetical protein T492DRAFT_1122246 [Pavlovales sp. CCMP2436]|nr:hypothetical protein T492DRAFT_1122246 [Pavlovales sp. CCMP2436]